MEHLTSQLASTEEELTSTKKQLTSTEKELASKSEKLSLTEIEMNVFKYSYRGIDKEEIAAKLQISLQEVMDILNS